MPPIRAPLRWLCAALLLATACVGEVAGQGRRLERLRALTDSIPAPECEWPAADTAGWEPVRHEGAQATFRAPPGSLGNVDVRQFPGMTEWRWGSAVTLLHGSTGAMSEPSWPLAILETQFDSQTGVATGARCSDCFEAESLCRSEVAGRPALVIVGRDSGWGWDFRAMAIVQKAADEWVVLGAGGTTREALARGLAIIRTLSMP